MRKIVVDFYAELFGLKDCDPESMDQLLRGLPSLKPEDRKTLDKLISYEELSEAVKQLSTGRAPGVDGLPAEFYKSFWNILGEDFYHVVNVLKKVFYPAAVKEQYYHFCPKRVI